MWRALVVVVLALAVAAGADERAPAPRASAPESLALATLLVQGDDLDRAARVLDEIDEQDPELDRARFLRLRGFLHLKAGRYDDAYRDLDDAVKAGERAPAVLTQRARAAYGAGRHADALAALDDAGPAAREDPTLLLLRARALRALGDDAQALQALAFGRARFPAASALAVESVDVLVARGLTVEAAALAIDALARAGDDVTVGRALASPFRAKATGVHGLAVLEAARARFPNDRDLALVVARAYAERDQPLAGALALEPAARLDRGLAVDVAELFRRAGHAESALAWNAAAPDDDKKLRQRFSILVDRGRFEEAAALAPRLRAKGMLVDADVSYALAYAWFATGRLDEADRLLVTIDDPRRYVDATALRSEIAACAQDARRCP